MPGVDLGGGSKCGVWWQGDNWESSACDSGAMAKAPPVVTGMGYKWRGRTGACSIPGAETYRRKGKYRAVQLTAAAGHWMLAREKMTNSGQSIINIKQRWQAENVLSAISKDLLSCGWIADKAETRPRTQL